MIYQMEKNNMDDDDTAVCIALAGFYDEIPDEPQAYEEPDAPFCGCGD